MTEVEGAYMSKQGVRPDSCMIYFISKEYKATIYCHLSLFGIKAQIINSKVVIIDR